MPPLRVLYVIGTRVRENFKKYDISFALRKRWKDTIGGGLMAEKGGSPIMAIVSRVSPSSFLAFFRIWSSVGVTFVKCISSLFSSEYWWRSQVLMLSGWMF